MKLNNLFKSLKPLNWKRILLASVVVTVVSFVLSGITCGWLFNWVYSLEPTSVWKPQEAMNTMWFVWMMLAGFFFALVFATIYAILKKSIPARGVMKGACFGLMIWFVSSLPMEFSSFMIMNIAPGYIVYSLIMGLVDNIVKGVIIAWIYK